MKPSGQLKKMLVKQGILISALLICLTIIFFQIHTDPNGRSLLNRLDFIIYDWRQQMSQLIKPLQLPEDPRVIIIDIDESSLAVEGRWPWSRYKLAEMVRILAESQVAVTTFDIVFSEKERNIINDMTQSGFMKTLIRQHPERQALIHQLASNFRPDVEFSKALEAGDNVLGFYFQDSAKIKGGQLPEPVAKVITTKESPRLEDHVVIEKPGYTLSLPSLQAAAGSTGFVTTFPDADGVIRRTPMIIRHKDGYYPSLALATIMSFLLESEVKVNEQQLGNVLTVTSIQLGQQPTPTDALGRVLIPYFGKKHRFQYVSATDLLHHQFDSDIFEGAIVFVGTSSIGLADLVTTPLETQFPGVEVQASVAAGLLRANFPYRPDWEAGATLILLIITAIWLISILPRLAPSLLILTSTLTAQGLIILNLYFWIQARLDLPMASIILMIIILTSLYLLSGFIKEKQNRQQIHNMFGQYVPSAHIDKMLNLPDDFSMDGESKELTVLFSDIRSFTTLSESLSASELKKLLNFYFTPITKVIFDHGGTIDKYVGDMVMAFWGAPIDDPRHRENAIAAALQMIATTEALKSELRARNLPEINVGIGLNTGPMNVGDMGSKYRKAYTVLGDSVNLGSRLESLTKFYGVKIMLGEDTVRGVEQFRFRFVDRIRVKGKDEAIDAYEPVVESANLTPELEDSLRQYHQAIEHYHQQQWQEANAIFDALNSESPCKLYQIYLDRIVEFLQNDPGQDWDGAFTHTSK